MTVRIVQGDALSVLRTLEPESIQVCVTSPPYFQLRDYQVEGQIGLESTPQAFIAALLAVFDEVRRVLRPDGLCFVNLGDSYHNKRSGSGSMVGQSIHGGEARGKVFENKRRQGLDGFKEKDLLLIPQRFAIAMQDAGWWVRSEIVWAKTSAMPESVKDRPTSAWEPIWMFAKSRTYYFDADAVRTPYPDASVKRAEYQIQDTRTGVLGQRLEHSMTKSKAQAREYPPLNAHGAMIRNVWTLGPEPTREEHYAAFPSEIPRRCIKAGSRPGDTVLDPFLGSGTTALVADQLGRHAIGIELNPQYVEIARRRLENDAPMVSEPVVVDRPTQLALEGVAG